jgi:hypothetical protein
VSDYAELLQVEKYLDLYVKGDLKEIEARKAELLRVYEDVNKEQMILNATLSDVESPDELIEEYSEEVDIDEGDKTEGYSASDMIGIAFFLFILGGLCAILIWLKRSNKKKFR